MNEEDEGGGEGDSSENELDFLRMAASTPRSSLEKERELTRRSASSDSSLVGVSFGRYRVVGLIGRGGMGVVYRATDTTLRRDVALKVLPEEVVADDKRRKRFLREARLAAAVTHANIATVFDVGEDEAGRVYIAMELVHGETLGSRLLARDAEGSSPLDPTEIIRIASDVARALARAHEAHIVHRDIKPDNIVIANDGTVKVLDFGLAKSWAPDERDDQGAQSGIATEPGRVLGTPPYMSPEQAEGQIVDGRSDVFSFGVVLYELCAGKRPYDARHLVDVLLAHKEQNPLPLERASPKTPRKLSVLVHACMSPKMDERPSVATILSELTSMTTAAAGSSSSSSSRAQTTPLILAAIVIAVLLLALIITR